MDIISNEVTASRAATDSGSFIADTHQEEEEVAGKLEVPATGEEGKERKESKTGRLMTYPTPP
jgi:hypothetical protein